MAPRACSSAATFRRAAEETGDRPRFPIVANRSVNRETAKLWSVPGLSRLPAALRGALWMVGALLSFSLMAVSVRELPRTMGNFEILALRSLVSLVLVLAVLPRFGLGRLGTRRSGLPVGLT